jgi:hypothetical protein
MIRFRLRSSLLILLAIWSPVAVVVAQEPAVVLSGAELARVVPTSFYFEGQSAPTQMRNAAAARFGARRFVIAGLVDTSGYSTDVQAKYQGFLITDSRITVGGSELAAGAYGFGFSEDKLNIFDVGGNALLSVGAAKDSALKRPRPLMMTKAADGVRLYAGRSYVLIAAK